MCSSALHRRQIFAFEHSVGIKILFKLAILIISTLPILIASIANQIIHMGTLADGNDGSVFKTTGY